MATDLENVRIQLVVAQEGFEDDELFVPEDIFSDAGAFVKIASNDTRTAHGAHDGEVDPDLAIFRINTDHIDALVIAGGEGSPQYLWSNTDLLEKVREANAKGKIIGAICLSPVVLAQAGILKGKRATVYNYPPAIRELKHHEAIYEDYPLVIDGNIVTARSKENAREFAEAVLEMLRMRQTTTPHQENP